MVECGAVRFRCSSGHVRVGEKHCCCMELVGLLFVNLIKRFPILIKCGRGFHVRGWGRLAQGANWGARVRV